jgi:phosphoheptose isomerase
MVFVVPLRRRIKPGDMVVAISSSGNSPNAVKAAEPVASAGDGTLTAMNLRIR